MRLAINSVMALTAESELPVKGTDQFFCSCTAMMQRQLAEDLAP